MPTENQHVVDVREFLLTCPHESPVGTDYLPLSSTGMEYERIDERQGSDRFGAGAAILPTGEQPIGKQRNTWGEETHTMRSNYDVIFWRDNQDDEFRRNIAVFLPQLIGWVNEENAKRDTPARNPALPHFSMTEKESISCDGGIRTALIDGTRGEYRVSVHCDYQIVY